LADWAPEVMTAAGARVKLTTTGLFKQESEFEVSGLPRYCSRSLKTTHKH